MCAILDANAASAVFRADGGGAAREFFKWISSGQGSLVVGGRLQQELFKISAFREWQKEAIKSGRVRVMPESQVNERTRQLEQRGDCVSNDSHVIALAQISAARLLYTNDTDLQKDFKNRHLINKPQGKVYSTKHNPGYGPVHKRLLNTNACRRPGT